MKGKATVPGQGRGKTVRRPVKLAGIGLVSLGPVAVTLRPGAPGAGITINGVPATTGRASVSGHATGVGTGRNRVRMVEHLLSACYGLGVTDLLVEAPDRELPFLDGSSLGYVRALERAGLEKQGRTDVLALARPVLVKRGACFIAAVPARRLAVNCLARIPGRGVQFCPVRVSAASYRQLVAPARTFGRAAGSPDAVRRALRLRCALTASGGLLFPASERLPDEPCRHKVLDLLGDLALLGRRLEAEIFAYCPGHRLNLQFVRALERSN